MILTSEAVAKKLTANPIYVLGCTSATDYLNYSAREDLSHFVAAEMAMKNASQMAKTALSDLQVIEVNDQSTMMELVSLEDLGFCEPGTAWKNIYESYQNNKNCYEINGRQLFVNTDGGLILPFDVWARICNRGRFPVRPHRDAYQPHHHAE